jgi:tetratricopeptide (TPR) repeat protein
MRDRYLDWIDHIVTATLKGEIRSKEQVYQRLQKEIRSGTGELFDRCLQERVDAVQTQLRTETDELKQAKATRQQRALKTIQIEWERLQQQNQANSAIAVVVQTLTTAAPADRLPVLLQALDPNQSQPLSNPQIRQLAQSLQSVTELAEDPASLTELATGLLAGLSSWQLLEGQLVTWIYENAQSSLGFGKEPGQQEPWSSWAKVVRSPELKRLFADLAQHQSVTSQGIPSEWDFASWLEVALVLQRLQLGLVTWFDKQPYDVRAGKRLSIATFLTFTVVWSQLAQRFSSLNQALLAQASFQMVLQVLYQFAQQDYFPLYGGLFAALSGESLQTMLDYLDQPLRQVANTQSKARILTLLGYSQRALGRVDQSVQFHQMALEIAQAAGDRPCVVANLNHLSRTAVAQQDYAAAIDYSQRALIQSRQMGDRQGEANALANLGYSEVFQAQQQNQLDPEPYDRLLMYLEQGLQLSEQFSDRPSQALCAHSLGVVKVVLGQYQDAIACLQHGLQIAQFIGDLALQGMNLTYLAEAFRGLNNSEMAVFSGCLGMYLLHQIQSSQWRQAAGILSILLGQLGAENFQAILMQYRPQFLQQIGVDGFDYLLPLLNEYRQ